MKRRNFLTFLGKAAVASGIAVMSGLPEKEDMVNEKVDENNKPPTIAKWNGEAWRSYSPMLTDAQVSELYIDSKGVLYAGGTLSR